jgi:VIT1/CCC1 family predicted Fe2+/Mn2+ transporter
MQHQENKIHRLTWLSRYDKYLGPFVYGGIDGSVTTFAVVAGAVGADLESNIIIILGLANLLADGFSMSVGAYLSSKAEHVYYNKQKAIEYEEVELLPEKEREEIREIYRAKGFEGETLERIVEVITAEKDRWVSVMMKEELGMLPQDKSPLQIGIVTYVSFILIGLIPLLVYLLDFSRPLNADLFLISSVLTGLCFILIGTLKSYITQSGLFRGIVETLLLGVIAAFVAYFVGDWLETFITR